MSNVDDNRLSKSLSWLLRHGAVKEGLFISPEGYVTVKQILQHKTFRGNYSVSDIQRVVASNQKQRFTLRENPLSHGLEIKANQGHSILEVGDEGLTPLLEPKYRTVVHGTYLKCWLQIKEQGLSCMSRRHIHLAKGTLQDKTVTSGLRHDIEVYIFINLKKALEEGLKFYESENGVILTSGDERFLPPKYFLKVTRVDTVVSMMEVAPQPSPAHAAPKTTPQATPPTTPRRAAPPAQLPAPPADDGTKIYVTGYPYCTQREDLQRAFAEHGARVEAMSGRGAVLRCGSRAAADAALRAPQRASVYGTILTVRRHSGAPPPPQQNNTPKRVFPKSKQKDVIVDPQSIDLSGDFHTQLDAVLAQVRLNQEEVQKLTQLYADLEMALGTIWPGCVCQPFGSITTGLGIKTSDADCFVEIPPRLRHNHHNHVNKAKRALQQYPAAFSEILAIPRANTPIVKLHHARANINCDVSFKSVLGVRNSRLVSALLHCRPALLPFAVLVKYWAKVHELCGSGRLSNYALTMLVLFYLQQPPLAVLPAVTRLQRDPALDLFVDGWNTGFSTDPALFPPAGAPLSIPELLGGFFRYYANFDFEKLVVCPYLGRPLEKSAFKTPETLPEEFRLYTHNVSTQSTYPLKHMPALCIQDPFEHSHNVAGGAGPRFAADLQAYFRFAATAYDQERPAQCRGLLPKVLLEKPKLVRARAHPEFRVNLTVRNAPALGADDWKPKAKDAIFTVFQTMLHLTLVRLDDATSRKERERYETSVTSAIWRRKPFAKICRQMRLPLVEQEARVTSEILSFDRTEVALKLNLILSFRATPRTAMVTVRWQEGEPEPFRDFGYLFLSTVQWWLTELLKPGGPRAPPPPPPAPARPPPAHDPSDESSDEAEEPSERSTCDEKPEETTAIKVALDVSDSLSKPLKALTTHE